MQQTQSDTRPRRSSWRQTARAAKASELRAHLRRKLRHQPLAHEGRIVEEVEAQALLHAGNQVLLQRACWRGLRPHDHPITADNESTRRTEGQRRTRVVKKRSRGFGGWSLAVFRSSCHMSDMKSRFSPHGHSPAAPVPLYPAAIACANPSKPCFKSFPQAAAVCTLPQPRQHMGTLTDEATNGGNQALHQPFTLALAGFSSISLLLLPHRLHKLVQQIGPGG